KEVEVKRVEERNVAVRHPLFSLRIGGIPHLANRMRLRHQSLEVVDESVAAVLGVLVVPADVNRFFRTDLLTVTAEDAAEFVDLEHEWIPVPRLILARDELDAVGRTDRRTESTPDTLRLAVLGGKHAMRPAPP